MFDFLARCRLRGPFMRLMRAMNRSEDFRRYREPLPDRFNYYFSRSNKQKIWMRYYHHQNPGSDPRRDDQRALFKCARAFGKIFSNNPSITRYQTTKALEILNSLGDLRFGPLTDEPGNFCMRLFVSNESIANWIDQQQQFGPARRRR